MSLDAIGGWSDKLSRFPKIKKILDSLKNHLFSYYVRGVGRDVIQSRLPDGVILQPLDSSFENYIIYRSKIFEMFYKIQDDDVVIDVGAHVGIFTLKAARKAKNGLVVAVEPSPFNYKLLRYNLDYNNIENVIPINRALSNYSGTIKLYVGTDSLSHTTSEKRKVSNFVTERCVQVKTQTLDELVDNLKLHKVSFIKINAEGAELSILEGAERTLQSDVSLVIAVDHYPGEIEDVSGYLQRRKYEVCPYEHMRFVYAKRK
jgi:FkbM family methyltransferase